MGRIQAVYDMQGGVGDKGQFSFELEIRRAAPRSAIWSGFAHILGRWSAFEPVDLPPVLEDDDCLGARRHPRLMLECTRHINIAALSDFVLLAAMFEDVRAAQD